MKIIFAGTPTFAAAALESIHAAGHEICLVLTQPDRPAGRGQRLRASAVAEAAAKLSLPIRKPVSLREPVEIGVLRELNAEVMVVAAYGLILPADALSATRRGAINIHASLLPRWRGAAPIHRAIEAGDAKTGISIMQMDVGLDTGPVLLERVMSIDASDTTATLLEKLTPLGAASIVEALDGIGRLVPVAQPADGVTYACKVEKSEARINWNDAAVEIERKVRAFDPFPGCESKMNGEVLKIWGATVLPGKTAHASGTVLRVDDLGIHVQSKADTLVITSVQRAGGRRISVAELLRSFKMTVGSKLE